jgi:hypothetical protein
MHPHVTRPHVTPPQDSFALLQQLRVVSPLAGSYRDFCGLGLQFMPFPAKCPPCTPSAAPHSPPQPVRTCARSPPHLPLRLLLATVCPVCCRYGCPSFPLSRLSFCRPRACTSIGRDWRCCSRRWQPQPQPPNPPVNRTAQVSASRCSHTAAAPNSRPDHALAFAAMLHIVPSAELPKLCPPQQLPPQRARSHLAAGCNTAAACRAVRILLPAP